MRAGRGVGLLGLLLVCMGSLPGCSDTQQEEESCARTGCGADEVCNQESGRCEPRIRCERREDCAADARCVDGTCVSCDSGLTCTANLAVCDPEKVVCADCLDDTSCPGALPRCKADGCAECLADADCSGATPLCEGRWCVACRDSSQCGSGQRCHGGSCRPSCNSITPCPASAPICADGTCVACGSETQCPTGQACYLGTCRAVLPGDTCRSAIGLALGGGGVEVRGGVSADYRADSAVPDSRGEDNWVTVFYRVQVATEGGLNVDVTPDGFLSDARVRIYGGSCDALTVRSLEGRSLRDVYVTPGTYYVAVRVDTFATRTFTLKLSRSETSRAVGNHCDQPEPLPVGAAGGSQAAVEGTTVGLHPVLPDACDESWPPQPDKVYELVLQERSHVLLEVRPLEGTGAFDLEVVRDCLVRDSTCPQRPLAGETTVWQQGAMEPGRYFVHVRGHRTASPFWFRATVTPWPANSTCEAPTAVPFVNDALELRGDLRYTGTGGNVCSGSVRQLHYRLSTRGLGARSLVVDVGPDGEGGPAFAALSTECPTDTPVPSTRVACVEADGDAMGPKHLEVPYLPEGDYFLQVYGFYSESRLFQLRAALGPAYPLPANDTCAGALVLTPDASGFFSATGDTRGANADRSDFCSGQDGEPRPGRDVVFQVPGAARGRLEVTLRPTSAGYDPVLFVGRSSSCSTTSSSGECTNAGGVGGEERYGQKIEQTGFSNPFTLWVDGRGGTEGTFALSGRLILPPANDVCAQAQTLTPGGAAVQGSLGAVYSDDELGCGIPYAPDLFYAFTAPSNGTAVLTLQPTGFDGVLAAGSACDSSQLQSCLGSANAAGSGGQETLSFAVTRNTRYLVRVGGTNLESDGTFSLSLRLQ